MKQLRVNYDNYDDVWNVEFKNSNARIFLCLFVKYLGIDFVKFYKVELETSTGHFTNRWYLFC